MSMGKVPCPVCGEDVWDSHYEMSQHQMKEHTEDHEDQTIRWDEFYDPDSFEALFARIFQEAFDVLVARQKKYGPENIENQGLYGIYVRMRDDKMARIGKAMNGVIREGKAKVMIDLGDEEDSVEDGYIDTANYALISLAHLRNLWAPPLEEDLNAED